MRTSASPGREPAVSSSLEHLEDPALGIEAGGEKRAAEAAAGVERNDVRRLDEPGMARIVAADHAAKPRKRAGIEEAAAAPPERVALRVERAREVEPGRDEEQRLAEGGAAE